MSGGHHGGHVLIHAAGRLHAVAPECKLAATLVFVFAVVATPADQYWAFGAHAALVTATARWARVPLAFVVRRLVIEVPFVLFAVLLPIVGQGERVAVLGVSLSTAGLLAAWSIVVKGTLGVAATIVLAAATPVPQILAGLERLRVPRTLVAIAGFMVRYGALLADDVRRMHIARLSRAHDPRWIWQVTPFASSIGSLFVRSYERGERVYLAMESRGYVGTMPEQDGAASKRDWALALVIPALAWLMAIGALAR